MPQEGLGQMAPTKDIQPALRADNCLAGKANSVAQALPTAAASFSLINSTEHASGHCMMNAAVTAAIAG